MDKGQILVLATGGTIAGLAGSALERGYRPGQVGIEAMLGSVRALGVDAPLAGEQIANIGSEDIGQDIWQRLHAKISAAIADPAVAGVVITHGTDTAEETAFLLDQTLPTHKPVVLVGAMRPADAVGSDGLRNFANAVRVAGDADSAGRGVLVVMGDAVFAARDVRKARTTSIDAFRGFPRGPIAMVTPDALEWFGAPWRVDEPARFALPAILPRVAVLYAVAGIDPLEAEYLLASRPAGIVLAGFGRGTMPDAVGIALSEAARAGLPVVRASRVDEGLVEGDAADPVNCFVAARALKPQKARILLQLLIAAGQTARAECQAAFDRR